MRGELELVAAEMARSTAGRRKVWNGLSESHGYQGALGGLTAICCGGVDDACDMGLAVLGFADLKIGVVDGRIR